MNPKCHLCGQGNWGKELHKYPVSHGTWEQSGSCVPSRGSLAPLQPPPKGKELKGKLVIGLGRGTVGSSNRASEARAGERLCLTRRPRDTERSLRASVSRDDR